MLINRLALPFPALLLALVLVAAPATAQVDAPLDAEPGGDMTGGPPGDQGSTEQFRDWTIRCQDAQQQRATGQNEVCQMVQQVTIEETDEPIMEVAVAYFSDRDQPVALFTVPLGIRIQPGLLLQVGENEPVRIPVEICSQEGCLASMSFDENMLTQFQDGAGATVQIRDPRDQVYELPISLMGFSAALRRLRE